MCSSDLGVETEDQLRLIAAKPGVDQVQGYLFSPPVCADRLLDTLESSNNDLARSVGSPARSDVIQLSSSDKTRTA